MRLICPNCGAQYEVDAAMIPAGGRDVQCSNCVTTWFQPGKPTPVPAEEASIDDAFAPAQKEEEGVAIAPPPPRRIETSAGALEIIRQEAAREARMRAAEALETQEEMPLDMPDDAAERGRQARAQIAALTRPETKPEVEPEAPEVQDEPDAPELEGEAPEVEAPEPEIDEPEMAPAPQPPTISTERRIEPEPEGARRDLLPNIEDINATLSPDENDVQTRIVAAAAPRKGSAAPAPGRGFGFGLVIIAAVVAVIAYVTAGSLAEAMPDAAPSLAAYVEWVNGLRMALNGVFESLTIRLNSLNAG